MPFYYSALFNVWCYYEVEEKIARKYLKDNSLDLYLIDGKAISNFNFQTYAAQMPDNAYDSWTAELELNFLVYPKASKKIVPKVTLEQYLRGDDSSRLIGNYRVKVPADNWIAILAGKAAFGEPKFPGIFSSEVPSLNPDAPTNKKNFNSWEFTISAPKGAVKGKTPAPPWTAGQKLVSCKIDLLKRSGIPSNPSPISYYGQDKPKFDVDVSKPVDPKLFYQLPVHNPKKPSIGARWNILVTPTLYTPAPDNPLSVDLKFGKDKYENLVPAFKDLTKGPCVAIQTFFPEPVAIESGAYYI